MEDRVEYTHRTYAKGIQLWGNGPVVLANIRKGKWLMFWRDWIEKVLGTVNVADKLVAASKAANAAHERAAALEDRVRALELADLKRTAKPGLMVTWIDPAEREKYLPFFANLVRTSRSPIADVLTNGLLTPKGVFVPWEWVKAVGPGSEPEEDEAGHED